jgi:hypothetical protein
MKLFLEGKTKEVLKEEDTQTFILYIYKEIHFLLLLPLILQEVFSLQEVDFYSLLDPHTQVAL